MLTERSCVADAARTWARCADMRYCVSLGRFCDGFVLTWAAHQLGLPLVEAGEDRSRWRRPVTNADRRYAVTHPHKLPGPAGGR